MGRPKKTENKATTSKPKPITKRKPKKPKLHNFSPVKKFLISKYFQTGTNTSLHNILNSEYNISNLNLFYDKQTNNTKTKTKNLRQKFINRKKIENLTRNLASTSLKK